MSRRTPKTEIPEAGPSRRTRRTGKEEPLMQLEDVYKTINQTWWIRLKSRAWKFKSIKYHLF